MHVMRVFLFFCITWVYQSFCYFPLNMFRPNDIILRPPKPNDEKWQISGFGEFGFKTIGVDGEGNRVPVTQIWTPTQDALAMVQGFPASSPYSAIARQLIGVNDDGIIGNFTVDAKFRMKTNSGFSVRRWLPYDLVAGIFVPVCSASLTNVTFTDLTPASQVLVKEILTDDFVARMQQLDPSLDLGPWHKHGLGDVTILLEWIKSQRQDRPLLKNVMANTRAGMIFPTGVKTNYNQILSIPFGYDGSVGILFGGGLTLSWFHNLRGGIDAEFLQLFGNTRKRRIKTDPRQTEFLLLGQVETYQEFGFTQRYQLFLEACDIAKYANFGIWYQYYQHGRDHLSPISNNYSAAVANSALSLDEWSFQQVIFSFRFDPTKQFTNRHVIPHLEVYFKLPISGKRALLERFFGCVLSLSF